MPLTSSLLRRHDPRNMYDSIGALPDQVEAAWRAVAAVSFPVSHKAARHIVVAGMGGSALGTHLIQGVFRDRLRIPVTVLSDYALPSWVDTDALILLSSYSGGTEEVLAVAGYGRRRGIPMIALTTGGALASFAETHRIPAVVFKSAYNPCGQPRIGLGYAVTYQLGILRQLGVIDLTDGELQGALRALGESNAKYRRLSDSNPALDFAQCARLHAPLVVASEHLAGNAHIFANQWNENAKRLAAWFLIPELNHHLLEGLTGPDAICKRLLVLTAESDLYDPRNRRRYEITRRVLDEQGIASYRFTPRGATALEQAFDMLLFGGYAGLYRAVMNRVDPTPIPRVDHFKRLMGARPSARRVIGC